MIGDELWTVRAQLPVDEDFLVSSWMFSLCKSKEAIAAGVPLTSTPGTAERAARDAFWDVHRPVIEVLLANADVQVVCDVEDERVRKRITGGSEKHE